MDVDIIGNKTQDQTSHPSPSTPSLNGNAIEIQMGGKEIKRKSHTVQLESFAYNFIFDLPICLLSSQPLPLSLSRLSLPNLKRRVGSELGKSAAIDSFPFSHVGRKS